MRRHDRVSDQVIITTFQQAKPSLCQVSALNPEMFVERVQVLAFVQIPEHDLVAFAARVTERAIW